MTKNPAERRTHPRTKTELQLQVTPEKGGVVARVIASNISMGGLYCTSMADFPEMTRLEVRLMLPLVNGHRGESEPLDVEAVVVRRREIPSSNGDPRFELGLFFTNLDDNARETISRFLS